MTQTHFEGFDPRFDGLIKQDSGLEKLCTGFIWAEGPVYFAEGDYLLFSDIPNNRMMRWHDQEGLSVFRQPSNFTNGHYRDHQGRLISCEHGTRRVTRTEEDGSITVLIDHYQGKKLNSPNDVVVKSDGTIWFTDPPYGILSNHEGYKADSELGHCYVFRFDPATNDLSIVAHDRDKPNGLAFNLDETILYVSDTDISHNPNGWHHIFAYDVLDDKQLGPGRIFAEISPGASDGFRLDKHGYIFTSSGDSIQIFSPDGMLLGKIIVPEPSSNCTFGGPNKDRLFITATSSLYSIYLNTQGVQRP
jgi:gluconolactonase